MTAMVGIFLILFFYGLGVFYMRLFMSCVIHYQISDSAAEKRRKGQSKKEWYLYSRFRDVLPRLAVIWYFVVVAIHPPILAAYIILMLAGVPFEISKWVGGSAPIFDMTWIIGIRLMFWQPGGPMKFDRWIKKKGIKE